MRNREPSSAPCRVLWLAPNPNFYKLRFLERLAKRGLLELTVLCGSVHRSEGHPAFDQMSPLNRVVLPVDKRRFAFRPCVFRALLAHVKRYRYDVVLLPIEKKNLPLILFAQLLRWRFGFRLMSYNHATLRSGEGTATKLDRFLSRALFSMYDGVIFYTEQSCRWAIDNGLIASTKAKFANNTIDTESVSSQYSFSVNDSEPKRLLFVGRLVPSKRFDLLFRYFEAVQQRLPEIQLDIIGGGPLASGIAMQVESNKAIRWHGAISDEKQICSHMTQAHLVFVPGHSGLSIVHAFCYGKPYVTVVDSVPEHPPEINYLLDGHNGLVLGSDFRANVGRVVHLLTNRQEYAVMCRNAHSTAQRLDVSYWCSQIETAVVDCLRSADEFSAGASESDVSSSKIGDCCDGRTR